jgi:hypothetical protein
LPAWAVRIENGDADRLKLHLIARLQGLGFKVKIKAYAARESGF